MKAYKIDGVIVQALTIEAALATWQDYCRAEYEEENGPGSAIGRFYEPKSVRQVSFRSELNSNVYFPV